MAAKGALEKEPEREGAGAVVVLGAAAVGQRLLLLLD